MPVFVTKPGGLSYKLIPAPTFTYNKQERRTGDGRKIKPLHSLTFKGFILNFKGSPYIEEGDSTEVNFDNGGTFSYPDDSTNWDIDDGYWMLWSKFEALRDLLATEGCYIEVTPWNGQASTKAFYRLANIELDDGLHYKLGSYTFTLETEELICGLPGLSTTEDLDDPDPANIDPGEQYDIVHQYKIVDCSDNLTVDMDDTFGVFKCTHSISAKGYRTYDTNGVPSGAAWQNAKAFVITRTGYNPYLTQSGAYGNITGWTNYNHFRQESINQFEGTYSITDTFLLASGNYYEDYTVETRDSVSDPYRTVNVQGTINGLSTFHVGTDAWNYTNSLLKYQAASGAWYGSVSGYIYIRAQNQLGFPLNPIPVSQIVSHNFNKGVISYNTELNTRPLTFVSGAISETLAVIDDNPLGLVNTIAEHIILNRVSGGILQSINTTPNPTRTISYEAVFPAPQYGSGTTIAQLMALKPRTQVDQLISGLAPTNYYSRYITTDNENWSPLTQRYSRQYSWKWMRG